MPPPKPPVNLPSAALRVTLETQPAALRQMDPVAFSVRIADGRGKPVSGAQANAELIMPTMDMGKNTVSLKPSGVGVYSGSGRFSMDGDWDVIVTVVKGEDKTVRTFPFHVR